MANTLKYSKIVNDLMCEYADYWGSYRGVKHEVLADTKHHNFSLLAIGWEENTKRYVHNISFHIQVINDKVWIQQNNTDIMIADELIEKGIAKQDIVLGFIEPQARQYSGFAVA